MSLAPIFVEMRANISEFSAKMGEAGAEIEHLSKKGAGHYDKLGAVGKGALLGLAGVAVSVGAIGVKAAIEGEAAHARLGQAIHNAGGSMEELEPKVNSLSDKFDDLGYTNDEVETALANMTTALHDPAKAMDNLGLAADLARYKHIDLAQAGTIVAKAMEGNLKPLKALGIDLPIAAGGALKLEKAHAALAKAQDAVNDVLKKYPDAASSASKHHAEYEKATAKVEEAQRKLSATQSAGQDIVKGLAAAVGGQASTAAETYAGKMEAAKAKAENLVEKLGNALLPVIADVIGATTDIVGWFEKHNTTATVLAGVIGGALVLAIGTYITQMAIAGVTTAATGAKVVLVNAEVALAIAGHYAAAAASGVWSAAQWVLNAALSANPIALVVIGIAALAAGLILAYKHSETFRNIVTGAFSAIGDAGGFMWDNVLRPAFKFLVDAFLGVAGVIVHGAASAFGWLPGIGGKLKSAANEFDKFRDEINASLGGIDDKVIHVTAKLDGYSAKQDLSVAHRYAAGTQYAPGGLSLVGEEGPELVDLPRGAQVSTARQTAKLGGSDEGINININIEGSVVSERDLTEALYQGLLIKRREKGALGLG